MRPSLTVSIVFKKFSQNPSLVSASIQRYIWHCPGFGSMLLLWLSPCLARLLTRSALTTHTFQCHDFVINDTRAEAFISLILTAMSQRQLSSANAKASDVTTAPHNLPGRDFERQPDEAESSISDTTPDHYGTHPSGNFKSSPLLIFVNFDW